MKLSLKLKPSLLEQAGEVMKSADYPYVQGEVSMKVWKKKLLE